MRQVGTAAANGIQHNGGGRGSTERRIRLRFELIGKRRKVNLGSRARQPGKPFIRRERDKLLRNRRWRVVECEGCRGVRSRQKNRQSNSNEHCHGSLNFWQAGWNLTERVLTLILFPAPEQPELARIARRLRQAEMLERMRSEQPSARRALDETLLDQERLDDV